MKWPICATALVSMAITANLLAQQPQPGLPIGPMLEPPTRLEAMELRKGTVIVKGYTEIGRVDGEDGSFIVISAIELRDMTRGTKESGLAIASHQGGDARRSAISYVDYDEMDGFLAAIDSLGKLDPEATKLTSYEAQYRTRSNLELVSFDSNGQRMISIRAVQVLFPSGELAWSTSHFRLATLLAIRKQIENGKELLDKLKAPPAENK